MSHTSELPGFAPRGFLEWMALAVGLVGTALGASLIAQLAWPDAGMAMFILLIGFALPLGIAVWRVKRVPVDRGAEAQLLSQVDGVTGLPNHRTFSIRFNRVIPQSGVLLVLALDRATSKPGTSHAHIDDLCLMALAQRCREITRATDVIGRLDETRFAIYLPGAPVIAAQKLADKLSDGIQVATADTMLNVTMSVGMVPANGWTNATTLMRDGQRALDLAKLQGPANVFTSDLTLAA